MIQQQHQLPIHAIHITTSAFPMEHRTTSHTCRAYYTSIAIYTTPYIDLFHLDAPFSHQHPLFPLLQQKTMYHIPFRQKWNRVMPIWIDDHLQDWMDEQCQVDSTWITQHDLQIASMLLLLVIKQSWWSAANGKSFMYFVIKMAISYIGNRGNLNVPDHPVPL